MNISSLLSNRPLRPVRTALLWTGLALLPIPAGQALAVPNEDSLICSRITDSYAREHFQAAIWPRSAEYGSMHWCRLQVKAVEHCVPAETLVEDTNAPYEGFRGPELVTEYTCYKIRCANGEGLTFLGRAATIRDTFGARVGAAPKVARVCLPNQ
jgi:hypothetical protein